MSQNSGLDSVCGCSSVSEMCIRRDGGGSGKGN